MRFSWTSCFCQNRIPNFFLINKITLVNHNNLNSIFLSKTMNFVHYFPIPFSPNSLFFCIKTFSFPCHGSPLLWKWNLSWINTFLLEKYLAGFFFFNSRSKMLFNDYAHLASDRREVSTTGQWLCLNWAWETDFEKLSSQWGCGNHNSFLEW